LRIGPVVGFFKAQGADNAKTMWGAAMRLKLNDALGVEGSLHYRTEEYNQGSVKVTSWPVMVTGLIYPIPMLYGAIGAGWYNSSAEITLYPGAPIVSETQQDFGWHFGGGVELPLGTAATLVGDLRYVYLNYDFQNVPGSSSITSNFYVIDVSLLFNL
jgi:opacity protein-like surface antigen